MWARQDDLSHRWTHRSALHQRPKINKGRVFELPFWQCDPAPLAFDQVQQRLCQFPWLFWRPELIAFQNTSLGHDDTAVAFDNGSGNLQLNTILTDQPKETEREASRTLGLRSVFS